MMRFQLGSDEGGSAGGPDMDINGSWSYLVIVTGRTA